MKQSIIQTFVYKIAIVSLYLYLNIVDILTISCIFSYNKFRGVNIPLNIILLVGICIETYTYYYKCIQIEKCISNVIFNLSINYSIFSFMIYISWIIFYTDKELFSTIQLIILPFLKCFSTILNYYICRIRLLRNFEIQKDTNININENESETETYLIESV